MQQYLLSFTEPVPGTVLEGGMYFKQETNHSPAKVVSGPNAWGGGVDKG
jgi:hypothetical protein